MFFGILGHQLINTPNKKKTPPGETGFEWLNQTSGFVEVVPQTPEIHSDLADT